MILKGVGVTLLLGLIIESLISPSNKVTMTHLKINIRAEVLFQCPSSFGLEYLVVFIWALFSPVA
jgi:hypothetical protein